MPTPTAAVPTLAPTPTTGVVRYNMPPLFTGYAPVTAAPQPPTAGPQPPTPRPQPPGGSGANTEVIQPVLLPRLVPPASVLGGKEAGLAPRGLTVTYAVPRELIQARVPGAEASRSRATLADGRPLPAELEYDPTSQTFTIRDTSRLPLPLDVRLTMPTIGGGQRSFVLTIGSP
ncbi:MAG: hypothetical protein ACKO0M_11155 [Cyanobium sp.]